MSPVFTPETLFLQFRDSTQESASTVEGRSEKIYSNEGLVLFV